LYLQQVMKNKKNSNDSSATRIEMQQPEEIHSISLHFMLRTMIPQSKNLNFQTMGDALGVVETSCLLSGKLSQSMSSLQIIALFLRSQKVCATYTKPLSG
jgi:hypothetical protein